ncbi:MAG TPA: ribonuclease P protein component [Chromatiaceae bacterium]|nr:MAG: ribonuclease P protein component [Thiohalocapsa sp. PB-PSB1]HBG96452.1 ribonuclease P protein component [Chromatiaceae bacterium]HCS92516.1 ribonuclease P protein component [Chromatiaceae bacterium]
MSLSFEGFSRRHRLTRATQYRRVFAKPTKSSDRFFTLLVRTQQVADGETDNDVHPGLSPSHARLGLAISRKCAATAVGRNRIKRLVRESFRTCDCRTWPIDIVIMCRPAASRANNADLQHSLHRLWTKLRELECAGLLNCSSALTNSW